MQVWHLITRARGHARLVRTDGDRYRLLEAMHGALRYAVLGYRVMDTHLHVVAEGEAEHLKRWLSAALREYACARNRRDGADLWNRPVAALAIEDAEALAVVLRYDHENPLKARVVSRAVEYAWSSARAFAGLSLGPYANVDRALEWLGGEEGPRVVGPGPALADLEPGVAPAVGPELLLSAAAETFGVLPEDVAGAGRSERLVSARIVFAKLGVLESYRHAQLAPLLGRTRVRVTQLAGAPVNPVAIRIARTLVRDLGLRRRLRRPQPRVTEPACAPPLSGGAQHRRPLPAPDLPLR